MANTKATTSDETTDPKDQQDEQDQPTTVEPAGPRLRYLVAYPAISVIWETKPAQGTTPAEFTERIVRKGQYLDDVVPREVADAKGPFLLTIGHVTPVSA